VIKIIKVRRKKLILILLFIFLILILLSIIFEIKIGNKKQSDIQKNNREELWKIYDQNIKNIENNMNLITVNSEEWTWWELKEFDIDDNDYETSLNNLVANIRMCYLEFTGEKDLTSENFSSLLENRNSDNFEKATLKIEKVSSCSYYLKGKETLLISNDTEKRNNYLEEIKDLKDYEIDYDKMSNDEILAAEVYETTLASNLSTWLVREYYENQR